MVLQDHEMAVIKVIPHQHSDSHPHTNIHISYRCGKSRGQRHLQVAFKPQQCWNQDEHLRHLCEHRPVLQRPPHNISKHNINIMNTLLYGNGTHSLTDTWYSVTYG